jgi:N-methylhydantoinase B
VSREAAVADNGVVLAGELDDLESHDSAAADAARTAPLAPAEVFFDRGPRYVRLSGRASFADVDIVAS